MIDSSFKEIFNNIQQYIALRKNKIKTTYRNKHNKKQLKIPHAYTNNLHRSMYPMLHQSITLLLTSSQNNNIYDQRDLCNF